MKRASDTGCSIKVLIGLFLLSLVPPYQVFPKMEAEQFLNLLNEGQRAFDQSRYREALEQWEKGLRLAESSETNLRDFRAPFLMSLGRTHERLGHYDKALRLHRQALTIYQALHDAKGKSKVLMNLGNVYDLLGQFQQARVHYTQALALARELDLRADQALALGNLGVVHYKLGQYQKARRYYNRALDLHRQLGTTAEEGRALTNLGVIHRDLGQHQQARKKFERALVLFRRLDDPAGEAFALANLGVVLQYLDQYEQAIEHHRQALAIHQDLETPAEEAADLINLGYVFHAKAEHEREIGNMSTANGLYQEVIHNLRAALIHTRNLSTKAEEAKVLNNLGVVYHDIGEYENALGYQRKAIALATLVKAPDILWRVHHHTQRSYVALQNLNAAIFHGTEAINILERLRANIRDLEREARHSFLTDKLVVYEELAQLLIGVGRRGEALQILDLLKERESREVISRSVPRFQGKPAPTIAQQDSKPLAQYKEFSHRLVDLGQIHEALLAKQRHTELSPSETLQLEVVGKKLDIALKEFERSLIQVEVAFIRTPSDEPQTFPREELEYLRSFQGTLRDLGKGTVALYFFATQEQLHIIVTTGNVSLPPFYRKSPIGKAKLEERIREYRKTLQSRKHPLAQARQLYQDVFQPIAEDLKKLPVTTLMVNLYGALRYLPLGALHDGKHYVAEHYAIVRYTPAAKDKLLIQPSKDWTVAGLGMSQAAKDFPALPAVPNELDGIVKELDRNDQIGVFPGRIYLNESFTKPQLKSVLKQNYRVLHLASHFRLSSDQRNSFLLLGGGEQLTLAEFNSIDYPMTELDLLTLSACETAIGGSEKNERDGRELESFAVRAQQKGAKSILATLWEVADLSTGRFMQWWYQVRQKRELNKAETLQQVQKLFIQGKAAPVEKQELPLDLRAVRPEGHMAENETFHGDSSTSAYMHPYYWAAFILMGNFL